MADDRYNWLDKDAAERLLRGEPVIGPDSGGARELRQLLDAAAAAAGAGSAQARELPGEDAALAAFRQARHGSAGRRRRPVAGEQPDVAHTLRADLPERTRLARPFRRGFAVALAACAIGGVAVAAGTGMLPTPFEGGEPEPAASVSAAETPGIFETQEPGTQTEGTTEHTPDATPGQGTTPPSGSPAPGGDNDGAATGTPGDGPGPEDTAGAGDNGDTPPDRGARQRYVEKLCRAYESGNHGGLDRYTIRRLERAAGGADKVHAFCRKYLRAHQDGDSGGEGEDGSGGGKGGSESSGQNGSGQGGGDEDDDEHPPAAPSTTPEPGASTPAPAPSTTAPDAGSATPGTALSSVL
ncbi:hypothetical protein [Streptomyces sp. NPDC017993]|uniref:hypothetical protein n=1 Tax=Streptomyces sp. NPDC017993 TaxID=3365027 RepID=UPI003798BDB3